MKLLRYTIFTGLVAVATLSIGCIAESETDVDDPVEQPDPNENTGNSETGFLKAQQECIDMRFGIAEQWCHTFVGEKTTAYFCAREPPELLQTVPLEGRPNYFCGCDPGYGYAQCPYNINRDRQ